ncbi:MAG TPA: hypothetical protein VF591_17930 [Pyrinomonadaceae bacterium]|jgi:uncharacterized membrane protein YedE/YeeE
MRLFKHFAALALLLAAASPAFADIALPRQPTRNNNEVRSDLPFSRMTIERVEGLREARLQIPRAQLERLNAAAGIEGGGGASAASLKSAGTVVGGLFISLGVVLTGLLLARSRRRVAFGRATAALVVCAVAAGVAAVAAYANAPAPHYRQQDPGTLVRAVTGAPLAGSIRVEVVDGGGEIKLLVPLKARAGRGDDEEE